MLRTLYLILCLAGLLPFASAVMAADTPKPPVLLVWGDSLSAAYGIPVEQGWVSLMQSRLGQRYQVVNGSISGETSNGGLTRLPAALRQHQPQIVILELGANDGLRGLPLDKLHSNLTDMIALIQQQGATVVLAGIRLPPNYGGFARQFEEVYATLAGKKQLPFVPFLLEGVANDWDLMQADGLHPTAAAQPRILETVWTVLAKVLEKPPAGPTLTPVPPSSGATTGGPIHRD